MNLEPLQKHKFPIYQARGLHYYFLPSFVAIVGPAENKSGWK